MKTLLYLPATVFLALALIGFKSEKEEQQTVIPDGTSVMVALNTPLSTASNYEGDTFEAQTMEPIMVDDEVIVPAGTIVQGTLTTVKRPGSIGGEAALTLKFDRVVDTDGDIHPFNTAAITLSGKSDSDADIERVAGTTVAGAIIGGIAKGGKGAAIGALIGAGAGGTWAVATKGGNIVVEPGQRFRIETITPVEMPLLANK